MQNPYRSFKSRIYLFSLLHFLVQQPLSLTAEELIASCETSPPPSPPENVAQAPNTQAVILLASEEHLITLSLEKYHGANVGDDLKIPGTLDDLKKSLEPIFLNQPLTQGLIDKINWGITDYYNKYDHPFVLILIPQQNLDAGVLQIVVVESKLSSINVLGNRYFSSKRFVKGLHIKKDDSIRGAQINNDLAWMNRTPFHHTDILYKPGPLPGTTDIDLIVTDRLPIRPYVGVDNTGIEETGHLRWFAGFNLALFFDHMFSYQYTTSSDFKKFQAHTVDYILPFPWHHTLMVYGGYATAKPHIKDFHSKGHALCASFRYNITSTRLDGIAQKFGGGGFDFKRFNNNLVFESAEPPSTIINKNVNLTQFVLPFSWGEIYTDWCTFSTENTIAFSPFSWVGDQSENDFQALRPFANNKYIYWKGQIANRFKLPKDVRILAQVRWQLSSTNLLPSEQFSVGGFSTVRGYKERIVRRDLGILTNLEIYSPKYHFSKKCKDDLEFLAFFDYALVADRHRQKGERKSLYLMGIGPGLRYHFNSNFSFRFDWGFPLHRLKDFDVSEGLASHAYFSAIASY